MLASDRLNLEAVTALVVDDNSQALDILASVLSSFGVRQLVRASNAEEARDAVNHQSFDLIVTDAQMPGSDGYEFVHWLRRNGSDARRVTPVIVVTAHTRESEVRRARDCGANFIVAKPITPKILLERISWVAKGERMFVETDHYIGPDRRFQQAGPPPDVEEGRRRDDVPITLGEAESPNLTQDQLDSLVKPQKAST